MAILIAVMATLYVAVAAPLVSLYRERDAALATERTLDQRLRGAAAAAPLIEAEVGRLQQLANARKITLEGTSDALASAGLQSRIEELASADAITIASTEGLPATVASTEGLPAEIRGIYHRIGLRMAVNGTFEGLIRFLAALENTAPPLVLDNLQIHAERRVASNAFGQLRASLEVYGFRTNDAPPRPKP